MALSKTLTANGSKGHHKFTLTVVESSTSGNSSFLSYTFQLAPITSGYDWANWSNKISYSITIGSNSYTGTIPSYNGSSTVTLKSGSNIEIAHDSDGTKTINVAFSVSDTTGQSYTCGNASSSSTFTLTTLHQAPYITDVTFTEQNSQLTTLGVGGDYFVPYLSNKIATITAETDNATMTLYEVLNTSAKVYSSQTNQVSINLIQNELYTSYVDFLQRTVPELSIRLTDNKGGTSTTAYPYTYLIPYTKPTLEKTSTTIKRKSGNGTNLTDNKANINVVGTIYKNNDAVGNNNAIRTIGYKVWERNTSEPANYTSLTPTLSGGDVTVTNYEISNIDFTKQYNYKIILEDSYSDGVTYYSDVAEGTIPLGQPTWSEYADHIDFLALTIGQNPIIASGNNANGYYVKYYDGTMECWNTSVSISANSNNSSWTYPQEFYSTSGLVITITPLYTAGQGNSADAINCISNISKSSVSFYNRVNGATPTYARNVQIRAIGKWK